VAASGEAGLDDYANPYMGPNGAVTVTGVPSRALTLATINSIGGHVIALAGVGTGSSGDPKARGLAAAAATGTVVTPADFGQAGARPAGCAVSQCCTGLNAVGEAVGANGSCPLSFSFTDSTGVGAASSVVTGLNALVKGVSLTVHTQSQDVDANTTSQFVGKIIPNNSGTGGSAGCAVVPSQQIGDYYSDLAGTQGSDGTLDSFANVHGVSACFDVVPKTNTAIASTTSVQTFMTRLGLLGGPFGGALDSDKVKLGSARTVIFIVPPAISGSGT
jgi:hypothetical protein